MKLNASLCALSYILPSAPKQSRKDKRKQKLKAKHEAELEEMAKEGNFSVSQQESKVTDQIMEGITDIKVSPLYPVWYLVFVLVLFICMCPMKLCLLSRYGQDHSVLCVLQK